MFGEDDSESPRLASPWDAFSTSPGSTAASSLNSGVNSCDIEAELARRLRSEVPRLAPEIEEGNIEYKLKLSPSPERLTRLITQLKWRLLEGGGQALYEIGVGDDGRLVGLSRRDMESSLDTLERMAGELGATVVVLREIVVPRGAIGHRKSGDDGGKSAAAVHTLDSTCSSSSGSADGPEAFWMDLADEGDLASSRDLIPTHARNRSTKIKLGQKADHKRARRQVKRIANATCSLSTTSPSTVPVVVKHSHMQTALGVPEVVVDASAPVVIPPDSPATVEAPNVDEVIIIEALVVRKLALEEAYLDFGGFSVLG